MNILLSLYKGLSQIVIWIWVNISLVFQLGLFMFVMLALVDFLLPELGVYTDLSLRDIFQDVNYSFWSWAYFLPNLVSNLLQDNLGRSLEQLWTLILKTLTLVGLTAQEAVTELGHGFMWLPSQVVKELNNGSAFVYLGLGDLTDGFKISDPDRALTIQTFSDIDLQLVGGVYFDFDTASTGGSFGLKLRIQVNLGFKEFIEMMTLQTIDVTIPTIPNIPTIPESVGFNVKVYIKDLPPIVKEAVDAVVSEDYISVGINVKLTDIPGLGTIIDFINWFSNNNIQPLIDVVNIVLTGTFEWEIIDEEFTITFLMTWVGFIGTILKQDISVGPFGVAIGVKSPFLKWTEVIIFSIIDVVEDFFLTLDEALGSWEDIYNKFKFNQDM